MSIHIEGCPNSGGGSGQSGWSSAIPFATIVAPPVDGWTWLNQDDATLSTSDNDDALTMYDPPQTGTNPNYPLLFRPLGSGQFDLEVGISSHLYAANYCNFGIALRQSSNGMMLMLRCASVNGAGYVSVITAPSPTQDSSSVGYMNTYYSGPYWFLKITDDGTYHRFKISLDGRQWLSFCTAARRDYVDPAQIGIFVSSRNTAVGNSMKLFHWNLTQ